MSWICERWSPLCAPLCRPVCPVEGWVAPVPREKRNGAVREPCARRCAPAAPRPRWGAVRSLTQPVCIPLLRRDRAVEKSAG